MPSDETTGMLEKRNRNLGSMFASDLAEDYLHILFILLEYRRNHEMEVLHDELTRSVANAHPVSCTGEAFGLERIDGELNQLEAWQLVGKRLEKMRIRSYKDVRRDRFRYSLTDETIAFLLWLEERHANDLLPRDDDTINLLEFVLTSFKQLGRDLRSAEPNNSGIVFSICDIDEKTTRLSRNLNRIAARFGEFLQKSYTVDEAREAVNGLEGYFRNYWLKLQKLRASIWKELETLDREREKLQQCYAAFKEEQAKLPRLMRTGALQDDASVQIDRLIQYYRRDGKVDSQCAVVHDCVGKVLGKLTSYLKELERRSNRLEFINLRLMELASKPEGFEPPSFLQEFIGSAAAPLDMNDADGSQKAEPPVPSLSSATAARRLPPRSFRRNAPSSDGHVETHDEMRLRLLDDFLHDKYPQGGPLDSVELDDGDFSQISMLLKYGLLGNGQMLSRIGHSLTVTVEEDMHLHGKEGSLDGPQTEIKI